MEDEDMEDVKKTKEMMTEFKTTDSFPDDVI